MIIKRFLKKLNWKKFKNKTLSLNPILIIDFKYTYFFIKFIKKSNQNNLKKKIKIRYQI